MKYPERWLGSESSHSAVIKQLHSFYENPERYQQQAAALYAKLEAFKEGKESEASFADLLATEILSWYDSTAVVSVNGPMSKETDLYTLMFGGVAYDAIASAVSTAVEEGAQAILMAYDTPGGEANGVFDLSAMLKEVGQSVPIYSWTSGMAASAGYLLGAVGREFRATKTAEVGSVGAISMLISLHQQLREAGVDVFIARAGKHKALAHPYEPISEAAKEKALSDTAYLHQLFIDDVIQHRPGMAARDLDSWAEGQTYFAETAIKQGLIDGPTISLPQFLAEIQSMNEVNMKKPIVLSEGARAALLSGASIESAKKLSAEQGVPPGSDEAGPGVETQPTAATLSETLEKLPEAPAEGVSDVPGSLIAGGVLQSSSDLESYLQATLAARDTRIEGLLVELAELRAASNRMSQTENLLKPIAVAACQRLQVALGQKPSKFEKVSSAELSAQYEELFSEVEIQYPVGRRSQAEQETTQEVRDPFTDRLAAFQGAAQ